MVATLAVIVVAAAAAAALAQQDVIVDGAAGDREFDGQGALSAGASSRLLADYPPQQREDILVRHACWVTYEPSRT